MSEGSRGRDSGRPEPSEPGDSHSRTLHEHRHQCADPGRRRHEQPPARQRLHDSRRPDERLEHHAGRHAGPEYRIVRQPDEHVPRHGRDPGDDHRLCRRHGRNADRRRADQLRAREGGNSFKLFVLRRPRSPPVVPGQQLHHRLADARTDVAQQAQGSLRRQRLGRRADRQGQAVVLRVGAAAAESVTISPGMYYNLNAGDPTKWTYAPDLANQALLSTLQPGVSVRGTWQASAEKQVQLCPTTCSRAMCLAIARPTSPESANEFSSSTPNRLTTPRWTSPVTSRLLLDARLTTHGEELYNAAIPTTRTTSIARSLRSPSRAALFPGCCIAAPARPRVPTFIFAAMSAPNIWQFKASATYVTGSHAIKVGFDDSLGPPVPAGARHQLATSYRFNNGVPNQITMRASPVSRYDDLKAELGMFIQDKWTLNKLTLTGGLRFDYFNTYFPATPLGPGPLVPTRNFTVPEYEWDNWKDLLAANLGGLRPVRQRQDGHQGQPRPVCAGRRQHRRQRVLDPRQHRHAHVGRTANKGITSPTAICSTPGQQDLRPTARFLRRDFRLPVRHPGAQHELRSGGAQRLGQARL